MEVRWVEGQVDGYKGLKYPFATLKYQKRANCPRSYPPMQGNLPLGFKETRLLFFEKSGRFAQDNSLLKWA